MPQNNIIDVKLPCYMNLIVDIRICFVNIWMTKVHKLSLEPDA